MIAKRPVYSPQGGRVMMTRQRWWISLAIAALINATGCYGGRGQDRNEGDGGADDGDEEIGEPGERLDARAWRLSPAQFTHEVTGLLGEDIPPGTLPAGATEHGISGIAARDVIDVGNVSAVDDVIRQLGTWAETRGASVSQCDAYGTPACVDEFLAWFTPRAFRRPVAADELAQLRALFDANQADHGYDYAFGSLVRTVLLSPDFLYRTEIGPIGKTGRVVLTDFEIASALSFSITDRGPDPELWALAAEGGLADPDVREAQVRRLMASSAPLWQRLFREWLGMTHLHSAAQASGVSAELVVQMQEEYATFVAEVAVSQRGTLEDLFTASYTWAQPELAALYGADHPGNGVARIDLPAERAGLLTQGAWLVSHASSRDDAVVRRGMAVFIDAMCNAIVPPPGVDVLEENDKLTEPDATVREVVEARAAAPQCGGCHAIPDPVGLAFEVFDNNGRLRDQYANGNPIESEVDVPGIGVVASGAELSRALVANEAFQACFVRRFAHVFVGHDLGAVEWTEHARDVLLESRGSLEELLVAFVRHDGFIERYKGAK
jgi:hypothetical protein